MDTKEELELLRHETVTIKQDLNSVKAEIGEMKNVLMALTERLNNSLKEKGNFLKGTSSDKYYKKIKLRQL